MNRAIPPVEHPDRRSSRAEPTNPGEAPGARKYSVADFALRAQRNAQIHTLPYFGYRQRGYVDYGRQHDRGRNAGTGGGPAGDAPAGIRTGANPLLHADWRYRAADGLRSSAAPLRYRRGNSSCHAWLRAVPGLDARFDRRLQPAARRRSQAGAVAAHDPGPNRQLLAQTHTGG